MSLRKDFLKSIEQYLKRQDMAPRAFGIATLNDPNFVFDLRKGRSPSLNVVERVQRFMAQTTTEEAA